MALDEQQILHPHLPPGFRFHPTDEELVTHYLTKKISSSPLPLSIITDVDLYKFEPWDLPGLAKFGEQEWYFFSPRERKYPNGARPNRTAGCGYWKATGIDKPVVLSGSSLQVGAKKSLVFYKGKPPRGIKTKWIMHEYRLTDSIRPRSASSKKKWSMLLDDWVLCRIFKRVNHLLRTGEAGEAMAFSTQQKLQELQLTPIFESFHEKVQEQEQEDFLGRVLRKDSPSDHDAGGALPLPTDLISKRNLSFVFDDLLLNNNNNNNSSLFQSLSPLDVSVDDFHQIYSLPFTENRVWSTENVWFS